jgi:hypothetical protein
MQNPEDTAPGKDSSAMLLAQVEYFESMLERSRVLSGSEVRDDLPIPRLEVELQDQVQPEHSVWRYSLILGRGERLRRSVALEIVEQSLSASLVVKNPGTATQIPYSVPWSSDAQELGIPVFLVIGESVTQLTAAQ